MRSKSITLLIPIFIVFSFSSTIAEAAPLTVGNLLATRFNVSGNVDLIELTPSGVIAQTWVLACKTSIGEALAIGVSTDNYIYSFVCRDNSSPDLLIHMLKPNGVISYQRMAQASLIQSVHFTVVENNKDIWVGGGYQVVNEYFCRMLYTTMNSTNVTTITMEKPVGPSGEIGTEFMTGFIADGKFFIGTAAPVFSLGYLNSYPTASSIALSEVTLVFGNDTKDVFGLVLTSSSFFSATEIYVTSYSSNSRKLTKAYQDTGVWKFYSPSSSIVPVTCNAAVAVDISGTHTVFVTCGGKLYTITDNLTSFGAWTVLLESASYSFMGLATIKTPPTCLDAKRNQDEGDVDCGGSCSATCNEGQSCNIAADCSSGVCFEGICAAPTCSDTVKNQNESDIDCGGPCGATCAAYRSCSSGNDCMSQVCVESTCAVPTCSDGVSNQDETDIDCGGNCGATCLLGDACNENIDCASTLCQSSICSELPVPIQVTPSQTPPLTPPLAASNPIQVLVNIAAGKTVGVVFMSTFLWHIGRVLLFL